MQARFEAAAPGVLCRLSGPIERDDIAELCDALGAALHAGDHPDVICDVGDLTGADLAVVDALARMHLTARRMGRRVVVRHASAELCALIDLVGLRDQVLGGAT